IAGNGWPQRLERARQRLAVLTQEFPGVDPARALRQLDKLSGDDFALACRAAAWFAHHHQRAASLTARQVPISGLHAKWLDRHGASVAQLVGLDRLELKERPGRMHLTYLDP